jgi:hypothetical protein
MVELRNFELSIITEKWGKGDEERVEKTRAVGYAMTEFEELTFKNEPPGSGPRGHPNF